jgi:hypothetical protein
MRVATRSQAADRVALEGFLDALEEEIEAVRHGYEKYFAGVDRVPPVRQREALERRVRQLDGMSLRTTVLRFRAGGLRARFVTYKHYWTRVELELERGASRKDLMRLRRGAPSPEPIEERSAPPSEAAEQQAPPPPRVPPPPPVGGLRGADKELSAAGIDPAHLRAVFKQLVTAKKAAGESVDGLTFAALCRKLSREAPKLKRKHECATLQFEVSTDGGKVRLRSRPG